MNRVLTICPTRGRPGILKEMLDSFVATRSPGNHMVIYISADDPKYSDYLKLRPLPIAVSLMQGPRQTITQTYNQFVMGRNYKYYAPINDDHVFITPQWDEKLIEVVEEKGKGWGCAMAEDKLTNWKKYPHPSGCIMSGKMLHALGYMYYPLLHHIGTDVTFGNLMKNMGLLFECPEIVIEHRHWSNGMRLMDDNYKWVYGADEQEYGAAVAKKYLFEQFAIDKAKILEAMKNEK